MMNVTVRPRQRGMGSGAARVSLLDYGPTREACIRPRRRPSRLALAAADVLDGLKAWRIWWMLGLNDIRQRYRRSRIGQFWLTLSMAVFVLVLGTIFSSVYKYDAKSYFPNLVENIVLWSYIGATINESCLVFVSSEAYLRQDGLPKSTCVFRLATRNLLALMHNAVLVPATMIICGVGTSFEAILIIPGLLLLLVNGLMVSLLLGIVCTRYRDVPQIVASLVQILFFATPVMWQPGQLTWPHSLLVDLNPLASHLILLSEPTLGRVPALSHYVVCMGATVVLAILSAAAFARFRHRITYWL